MRSQYYLTRLSANKHQLPSLQNEQSHCEYGGPTSHLGGVLHLLYMGAIFRVSTTSNHALTIPAVIVGIVQSQLNAVGVE
ncbi:hypothetical protein EGR_03037 [Echinococcus granulosus]|uniref:Uncharacterized protein n=1 Tax=Echinococcus granulosus TaxID=6210 RepID=W6ULL1_ECHGR|nr:hypothetical protein EGR_03037 [Echinococcus granulosus]EUB62016.1 hypothetical protein EGR_03037 [Echinococcus granulosus]